MSSPTVTIVTIIILILIFRLERKLKQTKCQICGDSGKVWEEAHDSADLQATNCSYCEGKGRLQLNIAKKKRDKPTRPWRANPKTPP